MTVRGTPVPRFGPAAWFVHGVALVLLLAASAARSSPAPSAGLADSVTTAAWQDSLERLRQFFYAGQRYVEAESLAYRLVDRARDERGEQSVEYIESNTYLAQALVGDGRGAEALRISQRGLDAVHRARTEDQPWGRRAASVFAYVLITAGRGAEAESLTTRLLARDSTDGPALFCLTDIAQMRFLRGNVAGAIAAQERALAIPRRPGHFELMNGAVTEAAMRSNLAAYQISSGMLPAARFNLMRARQLCDSTGATESPTGATILEESGTCYYLMGDLTSASSSLERALAIEQRELRPDHPDIERTTKNLAAITMARGDLRRGRELAELGIHVAEIRHGVNGIEVSVPLKNLAQLDFQLGDYAEAARLLDRALRIEEASPDSGGIDVAQTLDASGSLYAEVGDQARARRFLERSIEVRERHHIDRDPRMAVPLNNLAGLEVRTGALDAAARNWERARAIATATSAQWIVSSLDLTGSQIALARGQLDRADSLVRVAWAQADTSLPPLHPDRARYYGEASVVAAARGNMASAVASALHAADLQRRHLSLVSRYLPERQAIRYAERCRDWLNFALALAVNDTTVGQTSRLFDDVIRTRCLVLDEMGDRRRAIGATSDPSIRAVADSLDLARERLAYLYLSPAPRDASSPWRQAQLIAQVADDKERLERRLADLGQTRAKGLARREFGLRELENAIPPDGAIVAYYRLPVDASGLPVPAFVPGMQDRYLAFVLSRGDTTPSVISLGDATRIESLVSRWRRLAGVQPPTDAGPEIEACERVGTALRLAIWDPVRRRCADARRVFIVPDGELSLVNWDALPSGPGRFLCEEPSVFHYLSAERDLAPEDEPSTQGAGLLAIGGPDFERNSVASRGESPNSTSLAFRGHLGACAFLDQLRFDALPGAKSEAEEVARQWRSLRSPAEPRPEGAQVQLLLGSEATEASFKRLATGRGVLHLATHGFFADATCIGPPRSADSATVYPDPTTMPMRVEENPLVMSGLALAGANRRAAASSGSEDGMLTSEEIAALDLEGTRWVVLSACGSALGAVEAGEGVLGLRRAFQIAGARTVVASLWPIEDQGTRAWIRQLYRAHFGEGRSTMDSMRAANLAVLQSLRRSGRAPHPSRWAAFVATGDWR